MNPPLNFAAGNQPPVNEAASAASLPEGWVDHPKTPITGRAIAMGVAIVLAAIIVAGASIYFRRTQLEQTTRFWGQDTILAMQSAPHVTLQFDADPDGTTIDLSGTPGLGHLRHALLEQRHYRWETEQPLSIEELDAADAKLARLTFSDPQPDSSRRIPTAVIRLELQSGWVGRSDGARRVQLIDRAQPAVRHFLTTLRNVQQARSDAQSAP